MTNLLRQGISMVIGGLLVGAVLLATGAYAQLAPADAAADAPMAVEGTLDVNAQIQYQGQILNPNTGEPFPVNTLVNLRFEVVDGGGAQLWFEDKPGVTLSQGGLFTVLLGSTKNFPDNAFDTTDARFLRITVNGQVLSPWQPITSVPWAINARRFDGLKTKDFVRLGTDGVIAFGVIDRNGSFSGTKFPDNLQINRTNPGIYEITIPGVDYNLNNYVTLVTPVVNPDCTSPSVPGTGSKNGRLEVTLYARGNPSVPVDCKFHFMTLEAP